MAEMVRDYAPADWDRIFGTADTLFNRGDYTIGSLLSAGIPGLKMIWEYNSTKRQFKNGGYVQFRESEYSV